MVPTAILLGLFGGLIPRFRWWSIPVIGAIWSILLSVEGDPSMSVVQIWIGGLAIGAVNGAIGVAFTWGVSKVIHVFAQRVRHRAVAP
ncbi:MAG: hypothetical protein WEE53_11550 [Acidimicrobiia bacterium]